MTTILRIINKIAFVIYDFDFDYEIKIDQWIIANSSVTGLVFTNVVLSFTVNSIPQRAHDFDECSCLLLLCVYI